MNRRSGRVLAHDEQTRADDTPAGHDRPNLNRSACGAVDAALGTQRPRPGEAQSSRRRSERLDPRAGRAESAARTVGSREGCGLLQPVAGEAVHVDVREPRRPEDHAEAVRATARDRLRRDRSGRAAENQRKRQSRARSPALELALRSIVSPSSFRGIRNRDQRISGCACVPSGRTR